VVVTRRLRDALVLLFALSSAHHLLANGLRYLIAGRHRPVPDLDGLLRATESSKA
jgi:hypothetical protein